MAYVYKILVDGVVRYIGKGIEDRAKDQSAFFRKKNPDSRVRYKIVKSRLSEKIAFALEKRLTTSHKGLWNQRSGGAGMTSEKAKALWRRPEYRQRQLLNLRRMSEKCHTSTQRAKAGARIAKMNKTKEMRERTRKLSRERWRNPEYRQRLLAALSVGQRRRRARERGE